MSIWGRIGDFVSRMTNSATSGVADVVEAVRTAFEGDPQLRRQVAFSVAMIALSAKMAKADGIVTQDEIRAFQQIFSVPRERGAQRGAALRPRQGGRRRLRELCRADGGAVRFRQAGLRHAGGHSRRTVPYRQGRRRAARARGALSAPRRGNLPDRRGPLPHHHGAPSRSRRGRSLRGARHRPEAAVRRGAAAAIASWSATTIPTG